MNDPAESANVPSTDGRRFVAALLSLVSPGAGHFLIGDFRRGVLWVGLATISLLSVPLTAIAGVLVGFLLVRIGSVADVFRTRATRPRWRPVLIAWALLIVWNAVSGSLIRVYVTQAFTIPSGAMMDTLLIGDYIMTDNAGYLFRRPRRADVIVFKYPQDEQRDFIKRVIGEPGEVVQIKGSQVYINGQALEEPYIRRGALPQREAFCGYAYGCEPTTVPPDSYFVMGDNRDNSQDSRYWGFVKRDKIKGRAFLVYWSYDGDRHWVRWSRLGHGVR